MSKTATQAYLDSLDDIINEGVPVGTANHGDSIELINHTSSFTMRYPIISALTRKLNYRYPAAEARWVIAGSNRLDYGESVGKTQLPWSDEGQFMNGAYGPKFVDQLPYIINLLRAKPSSRQAIINIWRDSPRPSKDIPCTTQMQFIIRENIMDCIVTMRSSDAYLGRPNDWTVFTFMAACVMYELRISGLRLGTMHVNSGSSHIYTIDIETVKSILIDSSIVSVAPFEPESYDYPNFISWLNRISTAKREEAQELMFGGIL